MEIVVGKFSGFCSGVEYTVKKAKEALNKNKNVYCLGEIVHNEQVVKELEANGMITVDNIEDVPDYSKVIFRAHGEAKCVYDRANEKKLDILDLTCGKVRNVHLMVDKEKDKSFIIIIGKKKHPEVIGTKGFAGNKSIVLEDESNFEELYKLYEESKLKGVYVVSQTTFSNEKFDLLTERIKNILKNAEIIINNTICDATEKRQLEADEISKNVDKMLIIGGKNSSNTKELAEIARKNCTNTYLIQDKTDLSQIAFDKNDRIGIMSGASTPKEIIEEIRKVILEKEELK